MDGDISFSYQVVYALWHDEIIDYGQTKQWKEMKIVLERNMGLEATIQCCTVALGAVKIVMLMLHMFPLFASSMRMSCFKMYATHTNMNLNSIFPFI